MKRLQPKKDLLYLHSIGPDILHRRGPHTPRYQRQVLHPCPTAANTIFHEAMPALSRTGPHIHIVVVFVDQLDPPDPVPQHEPIDILGQQDIAPPAQHQTLRPPGRVPLAPVRRSPRRARCRPAPPFNQLPQLLLCRELSQPSRPHVDPKCIVRPQRGIFDDFVHGEGKNSILLISPTR